MSNIVLIQDLLDSRKRREEELQFYSQKLVALENRLNNIRQEICLTNKILRMIEHEKKDELNVKL